MERNIGDALDRLCRQGGSKLPLAQQFMSLILRRVVPVKRINEICSSVDSLPKDIHVSDRFLQSLGVTYDLSASDQAKVPSQGPLVVVANHPYGAIEGIVLSSILSKARSDVRIMANFMLGLLGISELHELLILVDPFGRAGSVKQNLRPLRDAVQWVGGGGTLGIFPAGEVSHVDLKSMNVIDGPWSDTVARIIRKSHASVLPVYFEGHNSTLFCGLGLLHPIARTLMLPGQNLKKRRREVRAHVGKPISFKKLEGLGDSEMMEYLRLRTYNLQNRKSEKKRAPIFRRPVDNSVKFRAVVKAKDSSLVAAELGNLPVDHILFSSKNYDVIHALAPQIPNALHEIGRLREVTFRKAGEGTGNPIDVDIFDDFYQHIILWDRESREIIGAYRLGPADSILEERGLKGLYTNTLFEYRMELFSKINSALELGRSFVRPEHQKTYQPLMLLWSGIGRFVAKNPRYRYLFGAVSINNEYMGISRKLIVEFLKSGHTHSDLARFVRAKNPPAAGSLGKKNIGLAYSMVHDIQDFSELISDIEQDAAGVPILLKHYVKLGGKFLGFSVDPKFNNALDALVLVDLARTDTRMLERYMGRQGMDSFLQFNGEGLSGADAATRIAARPTMVA